mgnify:CR=1 FL=1
MEDLKVERLDHLGIISGVIKELGIIEMIDDRIAPDDQEEITTGEAVAGMILNGLGFSQRPPSLTPQFSHGDFTLDADHLTLGPLAVIALS